MKNGTAGAWLTGTVLLSLLALAPAPAQAQQPLADASSKFRVGLNLVPAPFGTWQFQIGSATFSGDTAFAIGFLPYLDYTFRPYFFVGFGPQFLFNVKTNNADQDAGRQLDLLLRLGAQAPIADRLQLYGYVAPGYSVLTPARGSGADGLVLGFHGGAWFDVTARFFVNAQLGYQFGYQSTSNSNDLRTSFFLFGLGAGGRL